MDASIVPVLLEYIESAKHENRKFLYEAAKLDLLKEELSDEK